MSGTRPHFQVNVEIQELTNIPQATGVVSVKWYIKDSPRSEARGKSNPAPIKNHRAVWNHRITTKTRMSIDRSNVLRPSIIVFEVIWGYGGNGKVTLGKLELNLSEHVGRESTVTRYLLKDSKVNSILNLVVTLTQTKGVVDYAVPKFSTPQIFGDITGVMDEQKVRHERDHESTNALSKLYHKTFAISWDPQPGDLDPETCVEDIFSGGDGFGTSEYWNGNAVRSPQSNSSSSSNMGGGGQLLPNRHASSNSRVSENGSHTNSRRHKHHKEKCDSKFKNEKHDQRSSNNSNSASTNNIREDKNSGTQEVNGNGGGSGGFGSETDSVKSNMHLLKEDEERDDFRSWRSK